MKHFKIYSLCLSLFLALSCDSDDDGNSTAVIDLEATSITFSVEPISEFEGNATITGTITNIGDDFSSGFAQQGILLYEQPLGATSLQSEYLVASLEFVSLEANETLEVSYTRTWSVATEFPPNYVLVIAYDPDIFIDSNDNNDDTNTENNSITESGYDIHALFD